MRIIFNNKNVSCKFVFKRGTKNSISRGASLLEIGEAIRFDSIISRLIISMASEVAPAGGEGGRKREERGRGREQHPGRRPCHRGTNSCERRHPSLYNDASHLYRTDMASSAAAAAASASVLSLPPAPGVADAPFSV